MSGKEKDEATRELHTAMTQRQDFNRLDLEPQDAVERCRCAVDVASQPHAPMVMINSSPNGIVIMRRHMCYCPLIGALCRDNNVAQP